MAAGPSYREHENSIY